MHWQFLSRTMVVATFSFVLSAGAGSANAQHQHWGGGHGHYQPGHLHRHGNHYDYHPGQYQYYPSHSSQYYVQPQQSYYRPSVIYADPHDGHGHDHGQHAVPTRRVTRYHFGAFSHVDDLAQQLETEANSLCLELHYNYQHNPGYRETYGEAYEILTMAKYIHGLEHSGNREKLRQVAGELDSLFHHVEGDVARWTGHHHRHVPPEGLTAKLENIENTLHHLMDDVGVRSQYGNAASAPQPGGLGLPPAP